LTAASAVATERRSAEAFRSGHRWSLRRMTGESRFC
jgi:hypothetical protein